MVAPRFETVPKAARLPVVPLPSWPLGPAPTVQTAPTVPVASVAAAAVPGPAALRPAAAETTSSTDAVADAYR